MGIRAAPVGARRDGVYDPSSVVPEMRFDTRTFRGDAFGGFISAVVALPLALAYGVASGLGAVAGLYGAIGLGFFAAVFGGTRTMISGPTAPLTVTVTVLVAHYAESLTEVFTIVMLAGLMQIVLGALKVGRYVAYTPYSVISGFMSGIGVIVIVMQARPLVGVEAYREGTLDTILSWPAAAGDIDLAAVAVAGATLAVMAAWPRRFQRFVPAAVVALLVGTLLSVLWFSGIPVIGEIPTDLPVLHTPDLSFGTLVRAMQPAVTIALIGSIDTLLTALVAESMTRQSHSANRDLIGQGIGHIATGILGGLPGGATVGTVANIRAGARTRVSGALCALILLALVLGMGKYAESIPNAVLAGVLMRVGWDFIDWRFVKRIFRIQREHLAIMAVTFGFTVLER